MAVLKNDCSMPSPLAIPRMMACPRRVISFMYVCTTGRSDGTDVAGYLYRQSRTRATTRKYSQQTYMMIGRIRQDNSGGLEVKALDGSWTPAPPIPGTFVINAGDCLERWTNGLCVEHIVANAGLTHGPPRERASVLGAWCLVVVAQLARGCLAIDSCEWMMLTSPRVM